MKTTQATWLGLALFTAFAVYCAIAVASFHDYIFLHELSVPCHYSLIEAHKEPNSLLRQALIGIACCILLEAYRRGFLAIRDSHEPPTKEVLWAIGAASLAAFMAMPFDSTDICVYINNGWLQSHYHQNPFNTVVMEIPGFNNDAMFKDHWVATPSVYGPLFCVLTAAMTALAGAKYVLAVYLLKAVNVLCHLAITAMLFSGARFQKMSEAKALSVAYLYGFNPFILMHEVVNAHNDIVMVFFSCLAIWLILQRRFNFVLMAVFAGISIKYASIALLPGMLYILYKELGIKRLTLLCTASAIPFAILWAYYLVALEPVRLQEIITNTGRIEGSLRAMVALVNSSDVDRLTANALIAIFVGASVFYFRRWPRAAATEPRNLFLQRIIRDSIMIQILLVCVVAVKFYPWYLTMFFPLALFLPEDSKLPRFATIATSLMLFSLLWYGFPNSVYAPLMLLASLWLTFADEPVPHAHAAEPRQISNRNTAVGSRS